MVNFLLSKRWKRPRIVIGFFVAELLFTVPVLALFALADPNTYRTKLWQDGYDNGFNSNPLEVLYAYANHRALPTVPLVWSQAITSFNVTLSVLTTFILLVKAVLFTLKIWYPLLSLPVHAALLALWIYSAYGQAGPDMSDPQNPQPGAPWYIARSCSVAHTKSNIPYCRQAKASFAFTVILVLLFAANTVWAVYSLIPSVEEKKAREEEEEEEREWKRYSQADFELKELPKSFEVDLQKSFEGNKTYDVDDMQGLRSARSFGAVRSKMKSAMTPRTLAFSKLEGRVGVRRDS